MASANLNQSEIDDLMSQVQMRPESSPKGTLHPMRNPPEEAPSAAEEPQVKTAVFEELTGDKTVDVPVAGMEVLLDVPLSVSVELGRARCYVKDLLNLASGSIVELDRAAGDPVDILVNGRLFATGEVVVIDENFGVRIREIVHRSKERESRKVL